MLLDNVHGKVNTGAGSRNPQSEIRNPQSAR
jgi:hypothetical protein